jgi:hypothetical protein
MSLPAFGRVSQPPTRDWMYRLRSPQARTLTRLCAPQRFIWPSRRLASTVAPDGSSPTTATNRRSLRILLPSLDPHTYTGAEATFKRFWKRVELEDSGECLAIMLDSRALKTPGGKPLLLPRSKLIAAALIVTEWENQRNVLKSHALPMVRYL